MKINFQQVFALMACIHFSAIAAPLASGWENPPPAAKLRAYWWWLNGNVTTASITHDLEQMQAKGFGGAILCDANGSAQDGNGAAPHGPDFFSPAWRELYKHTLREADRLGLEISLNIQSGWNLGGPVVTKDDAAKKYVWSETKLSGGTNVERYLPEPKSRENFYRDISVVAYRLKDSAPPAPLKNWRQKALLESLQPFSAPDSAPLFAEIPATPGEQDADAAAVIDLTTNLSPEGILKWHGYDLLPWLPVLAGRIVNSRAESDRFLFDYRQTLGELAIDNHYKLFRDHAHKHGILIHPESGGPETAQFDSLVSWPARVERA